MAQLLRPHRGPLACTSTSAFTALAQPALDTLFRQIACDMRADAVALGIDTGHGYRFTHYRADESLPENLARIVLTPPQGYRIHARPLSIGSPRRRQVPRSQLALVRAPGSPAFSRSTHRDLGILLPHLMQVIELAQELDASRRREACVLSLLERAECGCLMVAHDGTVLHHNAQAKALLECAGGALSPVLTLPGLGQQQRYAGTLAHLMQEASGRTVPIDLPTTPPLRLSLQVADAGSGVAAVTIEPTRAPQATLAETFRARYDLTPHEFRLCQALASGMTLKQCAGQWNRSYETLRAQLKSIFSKTGCHRQLALTLLLRDHLP